MIKSDPLSPTLPYTIGLCIYDIIMKFYKFWDIIEVFGNFFNFFESPKSRKTLTFCIKCNGSMDGRHMNLIQADDNFYDDSKSAIGIEIGLVESE